MPPPQAAIMALTLTQLTPNLSPCPNPNPNPIRTLMDTPALAVTLPPSPVKVKIISLREPLASCAAHGAPPPRHTKHHHVRRRSVTVLDVGPPRAVLALHARLTQLQKDPEGTTPAPAGLCPSLPVLAPRARSSSVPLPERAASPGAPAPRGSLALPHRKVLRGATKLPALHQAGYIELPALPHSKATNSTSHAALLAQGRFKPPLRSVSTVA